MNARTLTPFAILLGACEPTAPDQISYQVDVAPILNANCLRCHAYPAVLAPFDFRYDAYDPTDVPDPGGGPAPIQLGGVAGMAPLIAMRIVDPKRPMPPRWPLDDYQLDILVRWTAPSLEGGEVSRGAPRPGNHPPTIELLDVTVAPGSVTMRLRVADEDDDVVAGTLRTTGGTFVNTLRSGVQEITWAAAAGSYTFAADLDDGAVAAGDRTPTFVAGAVEIPMTRLCTLVTLITLAACGEDADVAPLEDYRDPANGWKVIEVHGDAPGHADSIRFIYANPIAHDPQVPALPGPDDAEGPDIGLRLGSILVKEVYADDGGVQGELRHIAIMRKDRHVERPLVDQGGWVFTEIDKPGDPEKSYDFCWGRCHAQAPFNGPFYDYTKLP